MHEDIDGHSPDWIERVQEPEAIGRTESEDVLAFTDDDKRLQQKNRITYTKINSKDIYVDTAKTQIYTLSWFSRG